MKFMVRQAFQSRRFVVGFAILMTTLFIVFVYPLIVSNPPLQIIGQGTFFPPGIYVSTYDSVNAPSTYTLALDNAAAKRVASRLKQEDRVAMQEWLVAVGIPEDEIDIADTAKLLSQWESNYDPDQRIAGMTLARQRYYQRVNASIAGLLSTEDVILATQSADSDALQEAGIVRQSDYVNIGQVANVRLLPLGTDNFGRDVLGQLIKAIGVSLLVGLVAGLIATSIGLTLGLVSGFVGGVVDDLIMLVTNLFTVIPTFVLLILISFSIGQDKRGAITIAIVIGFTSWVWTARAVRSQVFSLRDRDHVNLARLSGHPTLGIIFTDILPYIASYVVMAFILQVSSGILAEAGLSILGLGPRTTEVPTLGLMMNWAMIYQAHILGKWWAYLPVLLAIALITFSMNLMNTGLDQVFNPTLRE
ncbi:MAG: ABC transporter permease [Anaerolineae bacterium]|mgnify:CR=1 FL=1